MEGTIFPQITLDRNIIKWEDYISSLTPVHFEVNTDGIGLWFKREDFFCPMGYGNVNGGKLRQCIILMKSKLEKMQKESLLISGASIKSPQLPIGTLVAKHYGFDSVHIIGATKPETAMKAPMVRLANRFGSRFDIIKVGYNPALQKRVKDLLEERGQKDFLLNYGISNTDDDTDEERITFHSVVGDQVKNIPTSIKRLVIPAGSCNSAVSILFGIQKYKERFPNLEEVLMLGIGPDKTQLIEKKLNFLQTKTGVETKNFSAGRGLKNLKVKGGHIKLNLDSLHETGFASYQDEMKFKFGNVNLHPTYEGKMMNYLYKKAPQYLYPTTMFWVVGSKTEVPKLQENEKINLYA